MHSSILVKTLLCSVQSGVVSIPFARYFWGIDAMSVQKIVEGSGTDQSLAVSTHIPCLIQSLHNTENKLLAYFPDRDSEAGDGCMGILIDLLLLVDFCDRVAK